MNKTPTGLVSTSRSALIRRDDDFSKKLLRYRELKKVESTYLKVMLSNLDSEDRLHAQFNQAVTVTGRLSSSNPINLQNIPSRSDLGQKVRELFKGDPKLIICDWNQIELRLLAHFSKDSNLIMAFRQNLDVHTQTAKMIFNTEEPTKEQRYISKVINFSIVYGAGENTLTNSINSSGMGIVVTIEDSKKYLAAFKASYPDVALWKAIAVAQTEEIGYITTLLGRVIPIKNLWSTHWKDMLKAQREVVSYIVQGSAADIMKLAINKLAERLPNVPIVSTIHDELVIEHDSQDILNIVKDVMENCVTLEVPLVLDAKIVDNWSEK
mgnify:FL=1